MSDNDVVQFCAAMALGACIDVNQAVSSRSTIRTTRIENRNILDEEISKEFLQDIQVDFSARNSDKLRIL